MTWGNLRQIVRFLHGRVGPQGPGTPTDEQLLQHYVAGRDQAAFELLLWRHAALVWNVCRRVLHDEQEVEDAFQATFLIFVRKAPAIVRGGAVAGWLYRVACRVALAARARRASRREQPLGDGPAAGNPPDSLWHELRPLLDAEVNRLPERLRLPLVLCYLEGKTNAEAAQQLGCATGTIFSRLARGRELLRKRLGRRGLGLTTGVLTALLGRLAVPGHAAGVVWPPLVGRVAAGEASARAVALAEGVLKVMRLNRIQNTAAVLFLGVLLAAGALLTRHALQAAPPPEPAPAGAAAPPAAQEGKGEPAAVQVTRPLPGRLVSLPVSVRPFDQVDIVPVVAGLLKGQPVDIGDFVKKGQVLATVEAPLLDLEARQAQVAVIQARGQVAEAEARIAAARAEAEVVRTLIQQRQAELDSARAGVDLRQRQYERFKKLHESNAVSEQVVVEQEVHLQAARSQAAAATAALALARAELGVKQARVAQAEAALTTTRAGLDAAQLALQRAELMLNYTRLAAPFDGVVTERRFSIGEFIRPGDQGGRPLLTVMRTDRMRVVVRVAGSDVPHTEPGTPVEVRIDALPGVRLTGSKVSRTAFAEDEKTGSMRVEIDVPNPKQLIRPGMTGQATLHLQANGSDRVLRVPRHSLAGGPPKGGEAAVYVVRDGKAHRTPIEIGRWGGSEVVVLRGLAPTDRVVADARGLSGAVVPVRVTKGPDER